MVSSSFAAAISSHELEYLSSHLKILKEKMEQDNAIFPLYSHVFDALFYCDVTQEKDKKSSEPVVLDLLLEKLRAVQTDSVYAAKYEKDFQDHFNRFNEVMVSILNAHPLANQASVSSSDSVIKFILHRAPLIGKKNYPVSDTPPDFQLGQWLGRGKTSNVHSAQYRGIRTAAKIASKEVLDREVHNLVQLQGILGIPKLYGLLELSKDEYALVIQQGQKPDPEKIDPSFVEKALQAYSGMLKRGLYQRDFNPGNIIADLEDNPMLIDFESVAPFSEAISMAEHLSSLADALRLLKNPPANPMYSNQSPDSPKDPLDKLLLDLSEGTISTVENTLLRLRELESKAQLDKPSQVPNSSSAHLIHYPRPRGDCILF